MSLYEKFVQRWGGCRLCPLCEVRSKVVLCRGDLPCNVLFVGEAPGKSEDVLGVPFIGPAGKLLDQIIALAVPPGVPFAFTNLTACIPMDDEKGKLPQPPKEAIQSCSRRLNEFIKYLAKPKLIVAVGDLAEEWIESYCPKGTPWVKIRHPAFILRQDISQRGLTIQQCVVTIEDAVAELKL